MFNFSFPDPETIQQYGDAFKAFEWLSPHLQTILMFVGITFTILLLWLCGVKPEEIAKYVTSK